MNRKYLTIMLVLAGILVIGLVGREVYISMINREKIAVTVITYPSSAKITLSGVTIENNPKLNLSTGIYPYEISMDGFTSVSGNLVVSDAVPPKIVVGLEPSDDKGNQWVESHKKELTDFENASSQVANDEGVFQREKYPLIDQLPIQSSLFSIGYKDDTSKGSNGGIIVTIHAPDIYKDAALNKIRSIGFDPVDYKIEFVDSENPFYE